MRIIAVLLLLLFPLACFAQDSHSGGASVARSKEDPAGFHMKLPPHLKIALTETRDKIASVESMLPFFYVDVKPKQETGRYGPFELIIGEHWNRNNLSAREFADKKDEGLKENGVQIALIRQSEVTVANAKGVRDDFRIQQPAGWRSYARVIILAKDTFYVFLCTLGEDQPISENEEVFQKILDNFTLNS
jgi:hypothetical protein